MDGNRGYSQNHTFGNISGLTGSLANPFQYTGRDYDPETGLRYHRARYYDPQIGRFLTEDPIGFLAGIDFYSYVRGNPVKFADPFGLQTIVIVTYDKDYGITYGSHTAVVLTNTKDGLILYDPAGSYRARNRGSGGILTAEDDNASLADYIKYQENTGSTVRTFVFDTNREQENQIYNNAQKIGDPRGFSCAKSVSSALSGVYPFTDIKPTGLPGNLADQLESLEYSILINELFKAAARNMRSKGAIF